MRSVFEAPSIAQTLRNARHRLQIRFPVLAEFRTAQLFKYRCNVTFVFQTFYMYLYAGKSGTSNRLMSDCHIN